MMQRRLAPQPQGKPAQEPNEDQRRQENLGFHSGMARGASATQKKKKKKRNKVVLVGMELMSVHAHKHILLVFVVSGFFGFFSPLASFQTSCTTKAVMYETPA